MLVLEILLEDYFVSKTPKAMVRIAASLASLLHAVIP